MDRKILIALAAIAGVCAAILLFPASEKVDADVAVGADHTPDHDDDDQDGPKEPRRRINDVKNVPVPAAKEAAKAANEARRATPFYQHTQAVAKHWLTLANILGPAGQEEIASEMREVARGLRAASRPDGTSDDQKAALELEGRVLEQAQALSLDAEQAETLAFLAQAYAAATEGEMPPEGDAPTLDYQPLTAEQAEPRGE
jgi:hypothetical protein